MKKIIAVLLILMMLLAVICGCNAEPAESSTPTQNISIEDESDIDDSSEDLTSSEESEPSELTSGQPDTSSAAPIEKEDTPPVESNGSESDEVVPVVNDEEVPLRETLRGGVNFSCIDSGTGVKDINKYIYDRKYYDLVAEAGFDHIRFPVGMGALIVSDGPEYLLDNEALRYIDIAINHALDAGLVIILDNHHNSRETEKDVFVRIWEQLAERYRYYP